MSPSRELIQPYIKRDAPQSTEAKTFGRLGYLLEGAAKGLKTGFMNEWNRFTGNNIIATGYGAIGGLIGGVVGGLYTAARGALTGGKGVDEALDQINDLTNPYRRNAMSGSGSFEKQLLDNIDIKSNLREKGITDFESVAGKKYLDDTIYAVKQMETEMLRENTQLNNWDSWSFPKMSGSDSVKKYVALFVEGFPPSVGIMRQSSTAEQPKNTVDNATPTVTHNSCNAIAKGLGVSVSQIAPDKRAPAKTASVAPTPASTTSRSKAYEVSADHSNDKSDQEQQRPRMR